MNAGLQTTLGRPTAGAVAFFLAIVALSRM